MVIDCLGKKLDLTSPKIMGILNVTPDSFSDGGKFFAADSIAKALIQVQKMIAEGADIIDIGGESTRPGAAEVSESEEIDRVVPIIESISHLSVPISIDSSKPAVMQAAINAGAAMINDVCGLSADAAKEMAASLNVPVCIMHMQGQPRTMQNNPSYFNVVEEICEFLQKRALEVQSAGVKPENIIVDPGFGFGKSLQHNLDCLKSMDQFIELGYPLLVGVSRKSFLGTISKKTVDHRTTISVAAAQFAAQQGAHILRVHDVAETKDMLKFLSAIN
jgi:dihydropteroate synthase